MNTNVLIYKNLDFTNKIDILEFLASKLYKENLVEAEYIKAILERELEYPTALPGEVRVAIPHCEHILVKSPAIAIGVLNNEVNFQKMDDPEITLGVQIIIMLAIDNPQYYAEMLQKILVFKISYKRFESFLQTYS